METQIPYYSKSKTPFEDYLKDIHAQDYIGLDDDMSDSFEAWLENLQIDDLIDYGNKFAKLLLITKNA
jgi:hypothetical protein